MIDKTTAWRCTVCGYVHRGSEPPEECAVCGSPRERFEALAETGREPVKSPGAWRCLVCNYEHTGETPPDRCPVCATSGKQFEAVAGKETPVAVTGRGVEEFIVVGGGVAGVSAVRSIRQTAPHAKITLLTKDTHPPYYRLNLTRYLAGELIADQLWMHDRDWYREHDIDFFADTEVADILLEKQAVTLVNGETRPYDKLVLTAGAHAFIPSVAGTRKEGVITLRSLDDAEYILRESQRANHIVVIGGGVLGLELAGALAKRRRQVMLLESFEWLMPRQLNRMAAGLLQNHIEGIGISLKTQAFAEELVGDERVAGVLLKKGETLPADLVIITAGVRSNSFLARLAGLRVNQGVIVDDYMCTSDPRVFAAGDIAEHRGVVYGLWNAAQYQGNIAGMNAAGKQAEFGGIPRSNSLKVLGVDLLSIGKFEAEDGGDMVIEAECEGNYARYVFRDTHLVGAILYGNTAIGGKLKHAIEEKRDFSGLLMRRPTATDVWDYLTDKV